MPKKKKPKVIRLRKKADRVWAKIVLAKKGYKCEVCGSKEVVQAHHFFPKSHSPILRYDVENGVALCRNCHFKHHFREDTSIVCKILKKRKWKWYNKLEKKVNEESKRKIKLKQNPEYYEKVIEKLVKKFKRFLKER